MGRLQRDDSRSGGRLYFLVHKHVLPRPGPKLGHPNWVVQIPDVFREPGSNTDANSRRYCNPDCNANSNSYGNTDTESVASRRGGDVKPAARINVHILKRYVPVECG